MINLTSNLSFTLREQKIPIFPDTLFAAVTDNSVKFSPEHSSFTAELSSPMTSVM